MACLRQLCTLGIATLAGLGWSGVASAAPGELSPIEVHSQGNPLGYWEYLPSSYGVEPGPWPLLLYLGGAGTVGTGLDDGPCSYPLPPGDFSGELGLCNSLAGGGVDELIFEGAMTGVPTLWDEQARPFIVVAPQNPLPHSPYDPFVLEEFLLYVQSHYDLDPRRLYLAGHSQGGRTALVFLAEHPETFAAAAVFPTGQVDVDPCEFPNLGLWVFHGEHDAIPSFDLGSVVGFIEQRHACPTSGPRSRLTVFSGADHFIWPRTYRPQLGMSDPVLPTFDPYDEDLYEWLLEYDRPAVFAGPDQIVSVGQSVELQAVIDDEDPVAVFWSQVAGPPVDIADMDTTHPQVSGLQLGSYTFEVTVLDLDDLWAVDDVTIHVVDEPAGGTATTGADTGVDETADVPGSTRSTTASPTSSASGTPITGGWTTAGGQSGGPSALDGDEASSGCACGVHGGARSVSLLWLAMFGLGLGQRVIRRR